MKYEVENLEVKFRLDLSRRDRKELGNDFHGLISVLSVKSTLLIYAGDHSN